MVTIMEHVKTGKQVNNALESKLQEILMAMQHVRSKGYKKYLWQYLIDILNNQFIHFDALIGRGRLFGGNKSLRMSGMFGQAEMKIGLQIY